MQATSLMQKYEKSAEMYQLPREGRFLVKNDYGVVSNSKKQKLWRPKIISYDRKIMRMFLYHGQIPYNDLIKLMSKQIAR